MSHHPLFASSLTYVSGPLIFVCLLCRMHRKIVYYKHHVKRNYSEEMVLKYIIDIKCSSCVVYFSIVLLVFLLLVIFVMLSAHCMCFLLFLNTTYSRSYILWICILLVCIVMYFFSHTYGVGDENFSSFILLCIKIHLPIS